MVRLRLAGATDDVIVTVVRVGSGGDRPVDGRLEADRLENRNRGLRVEIFGHPEVLGPVNLEVLGGSGRSRRRNHRKSAVGTVRPASRPPRVDRTQKLADAMSSICLDSLTGGSEGRAVTVAEVFIDAATTIPTGGELGVTLSSGSRVGPNTLAEVLCTGRIRTIVQEDGCPVGVSHLSEAIPPAIRAQVWRRDQGHCVIDACPSRYRLEPHHLQHRADGGSNDLDNLALICWFHHHSLSTNSG